MKRYLIVEDVDEVAGLIESWVTQALAPCKASSERAKNTAEARLILDRRRPNLVLLDEILPGESSRDLLNLLLEKQIPVILISGDFGADSLPPQGVLARVKKPQWSTLKEKAASLRQLVKPHLIKPIKTS